MILLFRDKMSLFDWLTGGKQSDNEVPPTPRSRAPFKIAYEFSPLRLKAHKDSKVKIIISITNTSGAKQLTSVDLELPKGNKTGLDVGSSQKHHEARLGEIGAGESKRFSVTIHGSPMTKKGEIPIKITAYAHYLNYKKVLEQTSKSAKLRVI